MSTHLQAQIRKAAILGLFGALRDNFIRSTYYERLKDIATAPYIDKEERGQLANWRLQFNKIGDSFSFGWTVYFKDETLGVWHFGNSRPGSELYHWPVHPEFGPPIDLAELTDELFMRVFIELQKVFLHYIHRHHLSTASYYTAILKPAE